MASNSFTFLHKAFGQTFVFFFAALASSGACGAVIIYGFKPQLAPDEIAAVIAVPMVIGYLLFRLSFAWGLSYAKTHEPPAQARKSTPPSRAVIMLTVTVLLGVVGMVVMTLSIGAYYLLGMSWAITPALIVVGITVAMWSLPIATMRVIKYLSHGAAAFEKATQVCGLVTEELPIGQYALRHSHTLRVAARIRRPHVHV